MRQYQVSGKESIEISVEDISEPMVQFMYELIDICTQGVCFEIHRSLRLGYWELDYIDDEAQKEFKIIEQEGLDVFGQLPVKKQQDCICPNCSRNLAANRFAPHLEKCMGMGRNSSRIASRRLQNTGRIEDIDIENEVDFDWGYEFERKGKKGKREKEKDKDRFANSPKRAKVKKNGNRVVRARCQQQRRFASWYTKFNCKRGFWNCHKKRSNTSGIRGVESRREGCSFDSNLWSNF